MKKTALIFLSICWFLLLAVAPAHAYLDPGSGSMILQLLLGGVAGLAVILKLYWRRFLALFGISVEKKGDGEVEDLQSSAEPETGNGYDRQG